MATEKTNLPPETKILSQTRREVTDPPEPSSNPGLVDPSEPVAPIAPEEEPLEPFTETVDQPFTFDEGGEPPPEEPADEPEGDPLKDTQRAFHETKEELARLKKVVAAMVANNQMTGGGQQAPFQRPPIPPEMLSIEPTEAERIDPTKYALRLVAVTEARRQQESTEMEMRSFVDEHSDWQDLYPTMERIRNENPAAYQGPGALRRLHKMAKDREELDGYRAAMEKGADKAMQAGVQMQKKKGGKTFVSPTGSGGGGRTSNKMPADFPQWSSDKQERWLKDHGFWKENEY